MLIVNVKSSDSIDKALKQYKQKYIKTGVIKEVRNRQEFTKPSVQRRNEVLKASYKEKHFNSDI